MVLSSGNSLRTTGAAHACTHTNTNDAPKSTAARNFASLWHDAPVTGNEHGSKDCVFFQPETG